MRSGFFYLSMQEFYLFEAGSTKTTMAAYSSDGLLRVDLPGINPNRDIGAFKEALEQTLFPNKGGTVFFYGSGLASDKNKEIIRSLFKDWAPEKIEIQDDLIGAARAAFQKEPGIIAILGTGGICAYYDGERIVSRRGGYGYLIDDNGGGYELGKKVVAAWLNNDLSSEIDSIITAYFKIQKSEFTSWYYESKDLGVISSLILELSDKFHDPSLERIARKYFSDFVKINVLPLCSEQEDIKVKLVGSIAKAFEDLITNELIGCGIECDEVIKLPMEKLLAYHIENS